MNYLEKNKMGRQKVISFLALLFVIIFAGTLVALADDDDDEDDDNGSSSSTKTSVSKSTNTIILKDTDGDGILDKDDPHPEMAEIYIVKDDNLNGIVDDFEYAKSDILEK